MFFFIGKMDVNNKSSAKKVPKMNYILDDDGNPRPEPNLIKWAMWFEKTDRSVAQTKIGEAVVSTVFLGVDHNFNPTGPPILWETMVFGGALDQEMNRCAGSKEQAEAMHTDMVDRVKAVEELRKEDA
jgi:hypothetical protein